MNLRVAKRYAQALMDLGEETKTLDRIGSDMLLVESTVHSSRELRAVLNSPVIKPEKKRAVLTEIFKDQLHPEVISFLGLLVTKGRTGEVLGTVTEFRRLLDTKRNITQAIITSAVALTEDEQLTIQARLENMSGKRIHSTFSIDPSLKGGFIARIGDTLIDASLAHQLKMLREEFRTGGPILN